MNIIWFVCHKGLVKDLERLDNLMVFHQSFAKNTGVIFYLS